MQKQTPISYNQLIAKIERQILPVLNNLFYFQIQKTVSELLTYSNDLINLNQSTENQKTNRKSKRILIAEPEPDIQVLYSLFTKQYGFSISDVRIVESGNKCLEILLSNTAEEDDNNNNYDIIILDTHLPDISGFEVARKIRDRLPHKKIILTTTHIR